jgi:hypothetical protein
MMTKLLETEVLAIDDFEPWYQSLAELVFRSARLVLLAHLQQLAVKQVSSNHDPGFDEDRSRGKRASD